MELKTKVTAIEDTHDIFITREFDLPVDLLFTAYTDPSIVAQWMGTKVVKLDSKKHGSFIFETTDPKGNIMTFSGTIHDITDNQKIVRTFEFEDTAIGVQLEFLHFEKITDSTCLLTIQSIYQSVVHRNQALKMPFAFGLSMAHDRLQNIVNNLK